MLLILFLADTKQEDWKSHLIWLMQSKWDITVSPHLLLTRAVIINYNIIINCKGTPEPLVWHTVVQNGLVWHISFLCLGFCPTAWIPPNESCLPGSPLLQALAQYTRQSVLAGVHKAVLWLLVVGMSSSICPECKTRKVIYYVFDVLEILNMHISFFLSLCS